MRGSAEPDFRDRLEYAALAAVFGFLRAGSTKASRGRGRALGRFVARVAPVRREVALRNLGFAFPDIAEADARRLYRDMCAQLGVVLADFARFTAIGREAVAASVAIDDLSGLERLRDAGRSAFLVSAHFGNWEAVGAALAARGFPITALGARQRNPLVERMFSRYRERIGMRAITVRQGMRPLLRELREGRFLATLADQDGGPDGIFLDFLGRTASVQGGLFRLAARNRIPIVTGFTFLEPEGWRAEIDEPMEPRPVTGDAAVEEEARRLAAIYSARVAGAIRRRPDHWFWVHRRWHTRPPEERNPRPGPPPEPGTESGR